MVIGILPKIKLITFSRVSKFYVQTQIFFKMNPNNVFKINTVEKLLQYLNVNFGNHNKRTNGSKIT